MSPWLSLDDKDWEPILKDSSVKSYERSTVIYQQGDVTPYVYLVKEGRVVLDLYGINGGGEASISRTRAPALASLPVWISWAITVRQQPVQKPRCI